MQQPGIRLAVDFDPRPEDIEALRKWPQEEVFPDLATVAAGWVRADWSDGTSERVGDYGLFFLFALLDSAVALSSVSEGECRLDFGDGGGYVVARREGAAVHLEWHAARQAGRTATVDVTALVSMARETAQCWLGALLAVNDRLDDHPDVRLLREAMAELAQSA